ncbi:hypothetical protein ABZY68_18430 [Streptomyces sp. NPDC006482]|uniref:hypothetical protein n=1 Tax=Streptomyces sp. NPDC006482 TaxID=3154306 RepID=UPI0033AC9B68
MIGGVIGGVIGCVISFTVGFILVILAVGLVGSVRACRLSGGHCGPLPYCPYFPSRPPRV